MTRRGGFSLIEMLTVIVLIGMVSLLTFPRVRSAKIKSDLRSGRTTVSALYARARSAAVQYNRSTIVAFNGTNAVIVATPRLQAAAGSTMDTIGGVVNFSTRYGATVTRSADSLRVDPRGFGGNTGTITIILTRSGFTDSVVVSAYGRLVQ